MLDTLTIPGFIANSQLWSWIIASGVFLIFIIASGLVDLVLRLIVRRLRHRHSSGLRLGLIAAVRAPVVLFLLTLGIFLGFLTLASFPSLSFLGAFDELARHVWNVAVIAEVTFLAHNLISVSLTWYIHNMIERSDTKLDDRLLPLVKRVIPVIVFGLGTLAALTSLGIPVSPIWASLGIGSLAIALAAQPTLTNFFAGTYVVTEGELSLGDYIELDNGPAGYIVSIGLRSTKIRTWLNNLVIIPNSRIAESAVYNYNKPVPNMNVIVYCGVSYDSDLDLVERVVFDECQRIVDTSPHSIKNVEPWFAFEAFSESNITFWVFLQARDRIGSFVLTSEIVKSLRRRLREEGIVINYPVRKLQFPTANGRIQEMFESQADRASQDLNVDD